MRRFHVLEIRFLMWFFLGLCLAIALVLPAFSAEEPTPAQPAAGSSGVLEGKVTEQHSGRPLVGAQVEILGQPRVARTNGEGRYRFENLPAGTYVVVVHSSGYATKSLTTVLDGSQPATVDFVLDLTLHEEHVVVTASAEARDPLQVFQPTNTMGATDLERKGADSLGMTLADEPGVANTNLGTITARPVIRGLGSDRVLILEDGMRIADVSSISPDHAVATDPNAADRIEVVRGPANILYGSNAIGGVVNVIQNEIPRKLEEKPTGSLLLGAGTNANALLGNADFSVATGPVAYHGMYSHEEADNFTFDGGVAGNSQYDVDSGSFGIAGVGTVGSVGASYRKYEANYGIPVSDAGTAIPDGEPGVTLDIHQTSYRLGGEITKEFGWLKGARFQAIHRNYDHAEIEDTGEVGTTFNLDTDELRADFTHKQKGPWKGSFGVWGLDQDFSAAGEEVLVPSAKTKGYAAFIYEELAYKPVTYLIGARYDNQTVNPGTADPTRDFSGASGAFGALVKLGEPMDLAINITHAFKAPSSEELYASGPHAATFSFEQGDPDLQEETSNGLDLSLRFHTVKRFSGAFTLFEARFQNFIFLTPTGLTDPGSGLPILLYTQDDADFRGAEFHGDINLLEHFTLEVLADTVRGQNTGADEPLPQMPPARAGLGLAWENNRYFATGEARVGFAQNRNPPLETDTDGYYLFNVFGGVTLTSGALVHRITLRLENLTDTFYRNSVSLTKDIVPQPGRNVQLSYRLLF
jgi:iron complex outermembrane receptor protein